MMQRIPTLDGWRGIAIAMVILNHSQLLPLSGQHGVTIFFVLSGFLITTNLISRPIPLKDFYIRRFFRLMPAAWAFLGALILIDELTGVSFTSWPQIMASLLFYRNFLPIVGTTSHFWSLSIEEQFYLFWPGVLILLGARRCRWVAGLGIVGIAVFRWRYWGHYVVWPYSYRTEVRADALLLGCLLALLLSDPRIREHAGRWSPWLALPATAGLVAAIARYGSLIPLWESVCIAVLITATMLNPSSTASRIVSWKPLAWLGVVSYSVYLWQPLLLMFRDARRMLPVTFGVLLPLFAIGSYYLIEQPCTRFGRRLTAKASAEPERFRVGPKERDDVILAALSAPSTPEAK